MNHLNRSGLSESFFWNQFEKRSEIQCELRLEAKTLEYFLTESSVTSHISHPRKRNARKNIRILLDSTRKDLKIKKYDCWNEKSGAA